MVTKYRRISKKAGNFGRRTRTLNANGRVTDSFSSKTPGKNGTRRTISTNNKSSAVRTTITTKLAGGWTQRRTNTTNIPIKKSNRNSVKLSQSENAALAILFLVVVIICFIVYYFYWVIVASVWALVFYTAYKVFNKNQKRLDDEHNSRIFYEPYINKDDHEVKENGNV